MKYFIDTEFLEGTQKESFPINLIRKETKPTIDLISIGIISEDNREYYAISKDFNLKEAWNRYDEKVEIMLGDMRNRFPNGKKYKEYWIRDNVLKPIFQELVDTGNKQSQRISGYYIYDQKFTYKNLKKLIKLYGKTNKQIAEEIKEFTNVKELTYSDKCLCQERVTYYECERISEHNNNLDKKIEFYAYYADYDWVVFCQLFGKMIDLPKGFPMYCIDLKQELDKKADRLRLPNTELSKEQMIETIKGTANYAKQTNEHHSLEDAKWDLKLYKFLQKI